MSDGAPGFLITTPHDDDAIAYCNAWSKEIMDVASQKGFPVFELAGAKANKNNLESYLNKQNIRFVMLNGHGTPDLITGYKKEVILQAGKNERLLKGKVAYARSCWSLRVLGESCVTAGAGGFVGYNLPFMFISDPARSATPLKDELAKPCFVTSNMIPISMLKGNTVSETIQKAKSEIQKLIECWETKPGLVEAPMVAACLHWNSSGLGYCGRGDTRL